MFDAIIGALFLSIPLLISGSFHMFVVSKDLFKVLAKPINVGMFGVNKTWRGVLIMVVVTVPGVAIAQYVEILSGGVPYVSLQNVNVVWYGVLLGLGYVIPELPNSFVKRRIGIKPGEPATNHTFLFSFIDQADSALGCAIVYFVLLSPPWEVVLWIIILGPLVHLAANLFLYSFGLRKNPI